MNQKWKKKSVGLLAGALFLFSSSGYSRLIESQIGVTRPFVQFRTLTQKLYIGAMTKQVRVEASAPLFVKTCEIFYRGGGSAVFYPGQLMTGESKTFFLQGNRITDRLECTALSTTRVLSQLKVFVPMVPVVRPRPLPRPIPVPPRAGRNVQLADQSADVCISENRRLIQLRNQAKFWTINGVSSRLSTFWYQGRFSKFTLDVHTANAYAKCQKEGTETVALSWGVAFTDPNIYSLNYTVRCVPCE